MYSDSSTKPDSCWHPQSERRSTSLGVQPGLLRSRVTPGHGVDEVVGSAVGASGGSGGVGFAVGAVGSDGGGLEDCSDGGGVCRAGPGGGFAGGEISGPLQPGLYVPPQPS